MRPGSSILVHELYGPAGAIEAFRKGGRTPSRIAKRHRTWQSYQPWLTKEPPDQCSCKCWLLADSIWQSWTRAQKRPWYQALKAPKLTAYDLWMREALTLCNQNQFLPDEPSPSGGFSTRYLKPGTTYAPPPSCAPPPPPPANRWDFIEAVCVETDPDGEYATEAACLAAHPPAPPAPEGEACANVTDTPPLQYAVTLPESEAYQWPGQGQRIMTQDAEDHCYWLYHYASDTFDFRLLAEGPYLVFRSLDGDFEFPYEAAWPEGDAIAMRDITLTYTGEEQAPDQLTVTPYDPEA
jgi:hypothetical protein